MADTISFRRRNLPHWYVTGRMFFVTFRLKGSLPGSVVAEIRTERERALTLNPDPTVMEEWDRRAFIKMDAVLDAAAVGAKWLKEPSVARLVLDGLEWLEREKGWTVPAAIVMSNHVHCLMRHDGGQTAQLAAHLGIMKGAVAREANRLLGLRGAFWLGEVFDHWCRTPEKVDAARRYIYQNPVKTGLVQKPEDWPWRK